MDITPECLAIWNQKMERVVEPGTFKVMLGSSSVDIRLSGAFQIKGGKDSPRRGLTESEMTCRKGPRMRRLEECV